MGILQILLDKFNNFYSNKLPHQVVRDTLLFITILFGLFKLWKRIKKHGLKNAFLGIALKALEFVPASIQSSLYSQEIKTKLRKQLIPPYVRELPINYTLPQQGIPAEQILSTLSQWSKQELSLWGQGKASGSIYHGDLNILKTATDAYSMFALSNPLHPELFPYIRQMEAEVVRMTISLFNGDMTCCGNITSGGTESLLMAVKAYRDYQRAIKGITEPELIVPSTAHAAFDKACGYFGVKQVIIPVDPKTMAVRAKDVEKAITKNTIAIISSAPTFPHGVIDPIPELAALALKYKIGLHVDCCLGSYLIPFARLLGYPIPSFDFGVEGVTSISVDTHKYGYAPKGSSVLMFKNEKYREYMYYVSTAWVGGVYASPTIAGSRPGAIVASTWATVMQFGFDGYKQHAVDILKASDLLRLQMKNPTRAKPVCQAQPHPNDIIVIGDSKLSVVSFTVRHQYEEWWNKQSENVNKQLNVTKNYTLKNDETLLNIYSINSVLSSQKHWHLNTLQAPPSVHLCVTFANCNNVVNETFINDLYDAIEVVKANPKKYDSNTNAQLYGVAEAINIDTESNNKADVLGQDQNQRKYNLVGEMAIAYIDTLTYLPTPEEDKIAKAELKKEQQQKKD